MEYRITRNDELYHYGVPGMKWGHRKAQPTSLAGTGHRALAGVYGINQRYYSKNGRNRALANANARARNQQLKKAAAADARANTPEAKAARRARVKKAAAVGATVAVAALAVHGAKKYSGLKNEMHEMNRRINFGKQMTDQLQREAMGVGSNPLYFSRVSYQGNDFKIHDAVKNVSGYHNYTADKQQAFNTVRDYARAKKRYTGRY